MQTPQSGVYTKTIQSLASLSEGTSLVQLVKTIEAEAKTAGATKIVIEGIEIVNKKILTVNPKAAAKLGYTLERTSKTSIKLVKQL
ncbi:hypothetical protein LS482_08540 [Sinomicrobium kalidii]|uniref:hypothetical protein n=1 Tax=Sinomicrobium kalidii TaxID=2900738 RepID=UPI001E555598|nr:hypothetical protein [Sinomicrobium kalidii]UGU17914.1 hypothetical protein LS482_08540 [Sinomicrobium kalidii]